MVSWGQYNGIMGSVQRYHGVRTTVSWGPYNGIVGSVEWYHGVSITVSRGPYNGIGSGVLKSPKLPQKAKKAKLDLISCTFAFDSYSQNPIS